MLPKRLLLAFLNAAGVLAMTLALAGGALAAPRYKVLHAFGSGNDGGGLWGSLALDAKGNLYGTTSGGGAHGDGTVFQLTPGPDGRWSETILHSFPSFPDDGGLPMSTPILDAIGNLYGTTEGGGGPYKYGTIFELTPGSDGWKETVLHRFGLRRSAGSPSGPLIMDQAGNLYGTADNPFELSPGLGKWNLTILHKFPDYKGDGSGAYQGVILDTAGNVYGVTEGGGTGKGCIQTGCGTAYELQHTPGGNWKEIILHDFHVTNGDGEIPSGLILDGAGSLYGATGYGGSSGIGTVFRLTPGAKGHWNETILHDFTGGTDGDEPSAGLVMDKYGNLYGVTGDGGDPSCYCGVVYKLAPGANGKWKYTVLHSFTGYDGAQPYASLILDGKGNLYGTTATGGAGVAFELTP